MRCESGFRSAQMNPCDVPRVGGAGTRKRGTGAEGRGERRGGGVARAEMSTSEAAGGVSGRGEGANRGVNRGVNRCVGACVGACVGVGVRVRVRVCVHVPL